MGKKHKKKKATLQTISAGVMVFAFQQASMQNWKTAGIAILLAGAINYAYEELNLKQIPLDADDVAKMSQEISDEIDKRLGKGES